MRSPVDSAGSTLLALGLGLALALAPVLTDAPAAAQEIAGVAIDSAGSPLVDVPVALHRVGGGSGANVAATTTDEDGRFQFEIQVADSAVYFVATRYQDRMYIGPPARAGVERVTDYVLRADAGSEAGAVASALSGGGAPMGPAGPAASAPRAQGADRGGGGTGAAWFVAILALVVAAIFLATAPGYRRRRRREMVLELARLENGLEGAGPDADTAADRRRRDALRERLSPPA